MAQASFEPENSRSRFLRSAAAPHWLAIACLDINTIIAEYRHEIRKGHIFFYKFTFIVFTTGDHKTFVPIMNNHTESVV